ETNERLPDILSELDQIPQARILLARGKSGDCLKTARQLQKSAEELGRNEVVIEGSATKLIAELARDDHPLHNLDEKVKEKILLMGGCKASLPGIKTTTKVHPWRSCSTR
ncbi:MAG: hypothetical protein V3T35_08725, partial [Spirochaetia bacterium]